MKLIVKEFCSAASKPSIFMWLQFATAFATACWFRISESPQNGRNIQVYKGVVICPDKVSQDCHKYSS